MGNTSFEITVRPFNQKTALVESIIRFRRAVAVPPASSPRGRVAALGIKLIKSVYFMGNAAFPRQLRACAWTTASSDRAGIELLRDQVHAGHADEIVLESCQRLESYGLGPCDCAAPVRLEGCDALVHLAEVAAGLHSAVLGEQQILGQVRTAFADARGPLAQAAAEAIAAARELRRETRFNSHAGHLLDRALRVAGRPAGGSLLILGTGAMGRLVAQRAVELGFETITIAGRSEPERVIDGTRWTALASLASQPATDVVVGCLGSSATALTADDLPDIRELAIDLGTPRNFVPGAGWKQLLAIADLLEDERGATHTVARRDALARDLRAIVDRRLRSITEDSSSGVGAMRQGVERIRQQELARMQRLHPEIAPEVLDTMTRALVNQILHAPSQRLREIGDPDLERQLAGLFA